LHRAVKHVKTKTELLFCKWSIRYEEKMTKR